jgi:hypothetical protein
MLKVDFKSGRLAPEHQIVPLTPEHENEIKTREEFTQQQAAEREAIIQMRDSLHRLFPEKYSPNVSVEIMFKLSYSQAENLARLLKGRDL